MKIDYKGKMKIVKELTSFLGERKAVIGISGGLDSAVTAYLCARAVNKENIYGISMPYGDQDTRDANLVIGSLGINKREVNIKPIVDSFNLGLDKTAKGNLMARIRMCILYSFANQLNGLVIGTSNRSEIEIGYFTKYGDGGVDVEPIGNLYKTEVFELAKSLGVPQGIIDKKPSAGLWEGQTDEDELGITYKEMDAVLKGEVLKGEVYEKVQELRRKSEHKRITPPIIK